MVIDFKQGAKIRGLPLRSRPRKAYLRCQPMDAPNRAWLQGARPRASWLWLYS